MSKRVNHYGGGTEMRMFKAAGVMVLAAGVGLGGAACSSSKSAGGAAAPGGAQTSSAPGTATAGTAPGSGAATGAGAGASTAGATSAGGAKIRLDVPNSALLLAAEVVAPGNGTWRNTSDQTTPGRQIIDPDACDPVPHPQTYDPTYPHNPAWGSMRSYGWDAPGGYRASETVITYASADAARADFTKHQGWVANCTNKFQITDAPSKSQVVTVAMPGVPDSYGMRVDYGVYGNGMTSPADNSGRVYIGVILRGNSLAFVSVAASAEGPAKAADPGLPKAQKMWQVAAGKLETVYKN